MQVFMNIWAIQLFFPIKRIHRSDSSITKTQEMIKKSIELWGFYQTYLNSISDACMRKYRVIWQSTVKVSKRT